MRMPGHRGIWFPSPGIPAASTICYQFYPHSTTSSPAVASFHSEPRTFLVLRTQARVLGTQGPCLARAVRPDGQLTPGLSLTSLINDQR
ncbi:hypothetical protein ElyMa_006955900 [Elysia marginata]|uniref:Uncharacterized protein n=1 Tax=Elysia marginata TaxID=1093978 RepID=A0AAV4JNS2_9GAST|nr:hypothetical protein ElyMa_006955900 [Elysia marginata]